MSEKFRDKTAWPTDSSTNKPISNDCNFGLLLMIINSYYPLFLNFKDVDCLCILKTLIQIS